MVSYKKAYSKSKTSKQETAVDISKEENSIPGSNQFSIRRVK